jgi:hypothetical protein
MEPRDIRTRGEENISVIVAPILPGFSLESLGSPSQAATQFMDTVGWVWDGVGVRPMRTSVCARSMRYSCKARQPAVELVLCLYMMLECNGD